MDCEEESDSERVGRRYAGDLTPGGSSVDSERHTTQEIACASVPCASVGEVNRGAFLENPPDVDYVAEGGSFFLTAHRAMALELEAREKGNAENVEKVQGRTLLAEETHSPPLTALFGLSSTPKMCSQDLSMRRKRHGSVQFINFSSTASDNTMVDHGASMDHVIVRTPVQNPNTCKGVLQAYFSQSAKGCYLRASWRDARVRKPCLNGTHKRHSSYSIHNCVVSDAFKISVGGGRSTSCPVRFPRAETSGASCAGLEQSPFQLSLERHNSSATSTGCSTICSMNALRRQVPDELLQYRLAVQNAKKGRYGLSVRELLANPDVVEDDEEEQEEDSVAICENY
ncbi:hypothetical protein MOQ_002847 [Trypanosoma cruzi marinkellei]|uniref:Uncharacterized protein n=1 Tax=Trypanosoma cruzi marinkellei TaxID=85056 RepID=K2MDK5_TRYCR|nr:hypothetical protein MOQ_002847 [Trypanosoma cruzi marinkellei]